MPAAVPVRLTDGDLAGPPSFGSPGRWWREATDRLAGSDPGLIQLRTAVQAVGGMAVAVAAAYVFVTGTGAMQVPAGSAPAAVVAAQHHGVLVVGMLMAAITAMLAGFVVTETDRRGQLLTTVSLPLPMFAALTIGLSLGRWHVLSLAWLVVALMLGVYLRRFGPRGFAAGMVLFNGSFLGYFLAASIPLHDLGWVAAELYLGAAASLVVRFGVLRQDAPSAFRRMRRSYVARAHRLIAMAYELTDARLTPAQRTTLQERIVGQLTRLNESGLMIDGQLGHPWLAAHAPTLHQQLFDVELTLTNTVRFAAALTRHDVPPDLLAALRACLRALRDDDVAGAAREARVLCAMRPADDTVAVLADRFVQSVTEFEAARGRWRATADALPVTASAAAAEGDAFVPAVQLAAGWLPGSVPVANEATLRRGESRWFDAARLPLHVRSAIQIGVAAVIAIVAGGLVSERRLYWALLATFLAFLATTNSGEQVRKALFRVGGTAIGIVVGYLVVHVTGADIPASFAVIGVSLFLGIYLIRVNYMFMVIGITVTMSLLYQQLGEFTWSLLLLRLAETGIGVGAVVLTVLVVVPLRPQRVLTAGVLLYVRALRQVVERSLSTVTGSGPAVTAADVRALDGAHQSLVTTAAALRRATFGRNHSQLAEILAVAAAARNYARNLAVEVSPWPAGPALAAFTVGAEQLTASLAVLERRLDERCGDPYVRSASLFERAARARDAAGSDSDRDAGRRAGLVLRDLGLLDGALARLATALHLPVRDLDTGARRDATGDVELASSPAADRAPTAQMARMSIGE